MSDFNRERARLLMQAQGIDALVLFQPENFAYATGASGGVATMWRRAGGAIALVPFNSAEHVVAIVSDMAAEGLRQAAPSIDVREHRIWIDTVDLSILPEGSSTAERVTRAYREQGRIHPRPETFDLPRALELLRDALHEKGLGSARIGVDFEFMPVADFRALQAALPRVDWADGSAIIRRLRAVKSQREIARLRQASILAEAGLRALMADVAHGASIGQLSEAWRSGVRQAAHVAGVRNLTGQWDFIAVGPDPWGRAGIVEEGAIIKADVGCLIDGYSSDGARTFSFGNPSAIAQDIFSALACAFEAGLAAIRPGVTFGAVYAAVLQEMRAAGYVEYHRGHFGHAVGAGVGMEDWPFVSAGNEELVEPGMVLALEAPFYAKGVGALMIEDQLLVTETGVEVMNSLPRRMVDLKRS
ncbi:M24 family metallopeptidase [Microvirga calopogonii]|uniref:M24 family metallopeptidase n=1 Tax=Microvirga calopogonii TaxID=2078013 RepID=UPI000E0CCF18|nr:Xaa-Pro peptidase family protein [Microvirga calopogonii]